jgi:hypothetical protein
MPAMGTVTFMLSATGASGTVYRLRSATFMVLGPENKSIVGPTDPADVSTALTTQMRPGLYQVTLNPGWQMWRIPMAGTPVAVPAILISPATDSFTVTAANDSKVTFQFDVAGDTMVPGTLTIGIGVTELDGGLDGSTEAGAAGTSGAAGTTGTGGADGGTTTCGNGVLDPGEQCDSQTAFNNNTCNRITCQNIPIVCGDHLVQPGEQCDAGPAGSATCSPTCMLIGGTAGAGGGTAGAGGNAGATAGAGGGTAGATAGSGGNAGATAGAGGGTAGAGGAASQCLTCETQGTASGMCLGTKLTATSVVGCAGLTTTDAQTKCTSLLSCLQTHPNCSISTTDAGHMMVNNDPTACFCGNLDAASCSGAAPSTLAGMCTDAYFAVYGKTKATATSDDRNNVLGDWDNRSLPVGMANHIYACDVNNMCQSLCP